MIKMVADAESRRLLGVHLACHRGAEVINEAALAIRLRATIEDVADTLHVYPSMGEGCALATGVFQGCSEAVVLRGVSEEVNGSPSAAPAPVGASLLDIFKRFRYI